MASSDFPNIVCQSEHRASTLRVSWLFMYNLSAEKCCYQQHFIWSLHHSVVCLLSVVCRQHQSSVYNAVRWSSTEVQHFCLEEHNQSRLGPAVYLVSFTTVAIRHWLYWCYTIIFLNNYFPFSWQWIKWTIKGTQDSAGEWWPASRE